MTIRVNGTEMIRGVTVRLSSDGKILTMTGRNPDRTVGELTQILDGKPVIEVMDGERVTAIYQGMKMITLTMEVIGGVLTVTASMQVDTLDMDTADELRQMIALQEAAIREQDRQIDELGGIIEDQAQVIGTQAERITAQDAVIAAQTKQIAAQDKSLEEMNKAVSEAQSAAATAQDAISAIEEGIADA